MNSELASDSGFREVFLVLWTGKWVVIVFVLVFAMMTGSASWLVVPIYEAKVVVSPVTKTSGGSGLSNIASQLGGIASLAGLSISGDVSRSESIAYLQSDALTRIFIQNNNMLPVLFSKQWDAKLGKWKDAGTSRIPTIWSGTIVFTEGVRAVSEEKKSGMVSITIKWRDPKIAAAWANGLVSMANQELRRKAIEEANRHVEFLREQSEKAQAEPVRLAAYSLMEQELKKIMVASGTDEYAFKIIDPAEAPERKVAPKRLRWFSAGAILGFFISSVFLLLRK